MDYAQFGSNWGSNGANRAASHVTSGKAFKTLLGPTVFSARKSIGKNNQWRCS
jgi:hypothetical protein